jgi:predicted transcriptional regulator
VQAALDIVRGRWKPSILYELKDRPRRYSELQRALPRISPQALTTQLKQLEADGLVDRDVYAEVPAQLKAYFDQIIRVNRSFAFDPEAEEPYQPLLADKPTTVQS